MFTCVDKLVTVVYDGVMEKSAATKALGEMFAAKYAQAIANGATDAQAVHACRILWLEAIGGSK